MEGNNLNISLMIDENDRQRTVDMATGYDDKSATWELIVKHSDNILWPAYLLNVKELSFNYAIITIYENDIQQFLKEDGMFYVEKPARLYFE